MCVCVCVCVRARVCVCFHNSVGILRFVPNIFSLTRHLNYVILNWVFFVEIPLIQFSCLLVCPLICFFLLSVVVCLLLPEEDLMSKALVLLYHRSSSIGEYSFLVLFLILVCETALICST